MATIIGLSHNVNFSAYVNDAEITYFYQDVILEIKNVI